ncbi:MAG TPA: DUF4238 domain-containing protein [Acidobacteriota bacterium]|nr:DUF4238 domain-containing protein [Acidobacteriota bacterium]
MAGSTIGTNQHYVPQALLRGFIFDENREQIFTFDKQTRRSFPTTIRNIAAERDFYTVAGSDVLDQSMNRADGLAAPVLRMIREEKNLRLLNAMDLGVLAGFAGLQMLRTRNMLEQWRDMGIQFADRFARMGDELPNGFEDIRDPERAREGFLAAIPQQAVTMMRSLLNKHILLLESDGSLPFWLSDNPITKNNTLNEGDGLVGTLGLEVPGIEVYLPVSSQITVAFMSPLVTAAYLEVDTQARRMGFISPDAHEYLRAQRTGRPMKLSRDNVRFQNSLQVHNSERWVFSFEDSFADAVEMVEGGILGGPRLTMN